MTDDNTPEPFGFRVTGRGWQATQPDPSDRWQVALPHQCDSWDIAGDSAEMGYSPKSAVPHAEAVARLEAFIAEAKDALDALRRRREFDHGREKAE